jgi:ribosome biogenesis GTPase
VVVLNKADVAGDAESRRRETEAVASGAPVFVVSALEGRGVGELSATLRPGDTVVLLGSSGAGKSTLVNQLLGNATQRTTAVREDDDRGRHTTTARQMFVLPSGAWLIDTPGLREIQLLAEDDAASDVFEDVTRLAADCRFRDCGHNGEPGCAVLAAVDTGRMPAERLASLRKLRAEIAHQAERYDPEAARARRARWKSIHKAQKRMKKEQ